MNEYDGRILLAILLIIALVGCGCTGTSQSSSNPPSTTQRSQSATTVPTTYSSPTGTATSTTVVPTSLPIVSTIHFADHGIEFDYPADFSVSSSLSQLRSAMQAQGADLITVLQSSGSPTTLMVTRIPNPVTMNTLYADKKSVADTVNSQGMTLNGMRFVRYTVTQTTIPPVGTIVTGNAENANGQTGISYWLLHGGYEYDIVFTYPNAPSADSNRETRMKIIASVHFS